MSAVQVQEGSFLPTITSAYQAVEGYLEYLAASSGGLPAAPPVSLRPVDALLVSLMAAYQPGSPNVVDLASAATWGASTVLSRTIPAVRSVAVPRGSPEGWRFSMSRYLRDLDQPLADMIEVADYREGLSNLANEPAPLLILTALDEGSGAELAADVERWLESSPSALVLVLDIGETGTCPGLAALAASCAGSPRRLALLREQAPALAGSGLAIVGRRGHVALDEALFRIGRLFADHFQYLDLVKRACLAALDQVPEDDLAPRKGEIGLHNEYTEPDSIRALRRALDERNRELLDMRNSLTVRLVTRLRRLVRFLAPPGSPQRWAAVKARAAMRRLVRGGVPGGLPAAPQSR